MSIIHTRKQYDGVIYLKMYDGLCVRYEQFLQNYIVPIFCKPISNSIALNMKNYSPLQCKMH